MKVRLALAVCLVCSSVGIAQAPDPCATAPATCATLIATQATSETRIANTAVDVSLGVSTAGKDLPETQRMLAQQSNQLLAYLKAQKVERLITTSVSFSPDTRSQKNAPDKTVGYNGSEQVSFRITPEKAPELLAGVLANGANEIDGMTFTPTEAEIAEARQKLSEDATRAAVAQANAIAGAAGMHVVAIRNINVQNSMVRPMEMKAARVDGFVGGQMATPMQTASGDQQLSVSVSITAAAMK